MRTGGNHDTMDDNRRLRVGTVSSVSGDVCRVFFDDVQMMSGELKIVQLAPALSWEPLVGAKVLCLYDGTFNGNGYVLGTI